jgi:hypothetical protein
MIFNDNQMIQFHSNIFQSRMILFILYIFNLQRVDYLNLYCIGITIFLFDDRLSYIYLFKPVIEVITIDLLVDTIVIKEQIN